MSSWSPRERLLAVIIAVLAFFLLFDVRPRFLADAAAQSEGNVQDLLSPTPNGQPYNIWGDNGGRVFVTDGTTVFRSTSNGDPGSWQIILR